ncbi:ferredoxin [Pyrrhoderma noxium]|uniref:Ferredoxin n=1 Tax=Pyrrhoderma noxium TaxID=2282107 RepID=A0A286UEL6_9AGAM|nr:ferredoxin [Pyrrhoderma noxium]
MYRLRTSSCISIGRIICRPRQNVSGLFVSRPFSSNISISQALSSSASNKNDFRNKCLNKKTFGRRALHATNVFRHGGIDRPEPGTGIKVHFKDAKGELIKTVEANKGDSILDIAHEYDIDLEGACEGSVACSTCHVILSPEHYDLLPEPDDDENDMLDMAFGLTDTSRLGCQVILSKDMDGITCTLPAATRNMYVDGAKPTTH